MIMKNFICYFLVIFFLSSCVTKTVVEYRDRDVNHYITKVEKDTVMQHTHDSSIFTFVKLIRWLRTIL